MSEDRRSFRSLRARYEPEDKPGSALLHGAGLTIQTLQAEVDRLTVENARLLALVVENARLLALVDGPS
jgi:hypothetical protein